MLMTGLENKHELRCKSTNRAGQFKSTGKQWKPISKTFLVEQAWGLSDSWLSNAFFRTPLFIRSNNPKFLGLKHS